MYIDTCPECGEMIRSMVQGVIGCPRCKQKVLLRGSDVPVVADSGQGPNRRAFHRYATFNRVLVRPATSPDSNDATQAPFQVGRLQNLSGGGALVEADNLPGVGEDIELVLATSRKALLRLNATVRHRRNQTAPAAAGVCFKDIALPVRECVMATARSLSGQRNVS